MRCCVKIFRAVILKGTLNLMRIEFFKFVVVPVLLTVCINTINCQLDLFIYLFNLTGIRCELNFLNL